MRSLLILAAIVAFGLGGQTCLADPITYNIVNDSADQNGWTVSGTITTDGNTGTLVSGDITAWSFTLTNGTTSYSANSAQSGASILFGGSYLTATATALIYAEPSSDSSDFVLQGGLSNHNPSIGWSRNNIEGVVEYDNYFATDYSGNDLWSNSPTGPTGLGSPNWTIATAPAAVPEPSSLVMCGLGGLGVTLAAWRRRRAARA